MINSPVHTDTILLTSWSRTGTYWVTRQDICLVMQPRWLLIGRWITWFLFLYTVILLSRVEHNFFINRLYITLILSEVTFISRCPHDVQELDARCISGWNFATDLPQPPSLLRQAWKWLVAPNAASPILNDRKVSSQRSNSAHLLLHLLFKWLDRLEHGKNC